MAVSGEGFVDQQVKIRFSSSKGISDAQGKFVDSNTVSVTLPDLTLHRNLDEPLAVTVSFANKIYSITSVDFSPFAVTDAEKCIILGPALVDGCC